MRNASMASAWARQIVMPTTGTALQAVRDVLARCAAWLEHEAAIRRALATLGTIDDRLLADMGLTRKHLRCAVRGGGLPPIETVRDAVLDEPASMPPVLLLNVGALTCWQGDQAA